jgi:hypothetical protein
MIPERLRETIDDFGDLIEGIEELEIIQTTLVSRSKGKLKLLDGTMLWFREVWTDGEMIAYSYYWLRSDETVIIGWDNAPHHKGVGTFPHHKHVGDRIEDSQETDLKRVLLFIKDFLGGYG